ncbi:hypothetical protein BKE38_08450 [Pseudoroseomonas deserti]|uniref:Zinc-ribbon domain-containing protein n=1 Tax=Teichococcus deserti TaxID=1817963 RepID=A0A1V2H4T9_9PROT|nr:zinc-ribbon domain-containing protein [Pseudoroseomonas deserti]ONG55806.1 hypothetical protein BKE38_08450 [Pseudoroseomonas deserti]
MALMTCPECSHRVSDKALACPSCGYPIAGDGAPRGGVAHVVGRVAGTWLSVSALENIVIAIVFFGGIAAVLITLILVNR